MVKKDNTELLEITDQVIDNRYRSSTLMSLLVWFIITYSAAVLITAAQALIGDSKPLEYLVSIILYLVFPLMACYLLWKYFWREMTKQFKRYAVVAAVMVPSIILVFVLLNRFGWVVHALISRIFPG